LLADFVAEWTETQMPSAAMDMEYWTIYFDGSVLKAGAGPGIVFISPLVVQMRYLG